MPPKKPTKTTEKQAPAANDTAPNTAPHPWFPDVDASRIAKLQVKRLVYEDRKGLPGSGATTRVNLTVDPLPPPALTTERQLADTWGPGQYEVWPLDGANRFVGASYPVSIADEKGYVPRYTREFEQVDDAADATSETERVLRLQLSEAQRRAVEERSMWRDMLAAQKDAFAQLFTMQRDAHQSDFEALSGLVDRVTAAQSSQQSGDDRMMAWLFNRLERIEGRSEESAKEARELAIRAAKKPGEEPNLVGAALEFAPKLLEEWNEYKEIQRKKLELAASRQNRRALPPKGVVIDGITLPSLEDLRRKLETESLPPDAATVFRDLNDRGLLPVAYAQLLAPHLRPSDGQP